LWVEAPKFLRTWDWSDRWAMIALQPGELPAPFDPGLNFDRNADLSADRNVVLHARLDADPAADPAPQSVDRYLRAVADFEGVAGAAAASPAWQTAAATWPRHRWPALALGNQAYHFGNLEAAAHWYQQGLAANPFDPALANNLASVLGESGCARAAEALLRPVAARLDDESAWRSPIETTLQDLTVHEGSDPDSCAPYVRPPQEVAALPPPP
jgi:hypothetical protein